VDMPTYSPIRSSPPPLPHPLPLVNPLPKVHSLQPVPSLHLKLISMLIIPHMMTLKA
jgi:hypothetical protein